MLSKLSAFSSLFIFLKKARCRRAPKCATKSLATTSCKECWASLLSKHTLLVLWHEEKGLPQATDALLVFHGINAQIPILAWY
jgi:hypothetical protein